MFNAAAGLVGGVTGAAATAPGVDHAISYVTPWVNLAETSIRNNGKLTPTDWATAVGSTLAEAVVNNVPGATDNTFGGRLENAALRVGTTALVAGALSHYDKNAAQSYFDNNVGQEVGDFIGGGIRSYAKEHLPPPTSPLEEALARSSFLPSEQQQEVQSAPAAEAGSVQAAEGIMTFNASGYRNSALDQLTLGNLGANGSAPTSDQAAVTVDQNGNPVAPNVTTGNSATAADIQQFEPGPAGPSGPSQEQLQGVYAQIGAGAKASIDENSAQISRDAGADLALGLDWQSSINPSTGFAANGGNPQRPCRRHRKRPGSGRLRRS